MYDLPCHQFHAQQLERQLQAAKEAKEMQSFHKRQVAELVEHKMSEHREEEALEHRNMELLKVSRLSPAPASS